MVAVQTVVSVVLAAVFSLCSVQAGTQAVTSPLEGVWVAQEMVSRGQPAPSAAVRSVRFVFKGDKVTIRGNSRNEPEKEEVCPFTIDASASPHRIDIVSPGGTMQGIYEINGGVLKLALGRGDARPSDFTSASGSAVTVITFKKGE